MDYVELLFLNPILNLYLFLDLYSKFLRSHYRDQVQGIFSARYIKAPLIDVASIGVINGDCKFYITILSILLIYNVSANICIKEVCC